MNNNTRKWQHVKAKAGLVLAGVATVATVALLTSGSAQAKAKKEIACTTISKTQVLTDGGQYTIPAKGTMLIRSAYTDREGRAWVYGRQPGHSLGHARYAGNFSPDTCNLDQFDS